MPLTDLLRFFPRGVVLYIQFDLQFDFHLVSDGLTTDWTLDILFGPIVHLDLLEAR
jgi:hypothetical protein